MEKIAQRKKRQRRIKSKVSGSKKRLRLSVFRSNKYIYSQLIDDEAAVTLISQSDKNLKIKSGDDKEIDLKGKLKKAFLAGEELAKKALKKNIKVVVFDRGGYKYHGRVKAFAQGARKGGLNF